MQEYDEICRRKLEIYRKTMGISRNTVKIM